MSRTPGRAGRGGGGGGGRPRRPRQRRQRGESYVGTRHEVEVGPVAHGGHFVARAPLPDGSSRVVFVRHALPGERVVVEITEGSAGDRFWRGDAVTVLSASPDRVPAPCPYAGPGLCGGCDLQHVALPAQRRLKADVVREQMVRLGGLAADDPLLVQLVVSAVPGDVDGLRWRTRQRYVATPEGGRGLRRYRSHEVIAVEDCLIARPDAREGGTGTVTETVTAAGTTHDFAVAADGFWQVHPGAPRTLVEEVLRGLGPQPGESVLDLYAGVGLFSAFLADRVGPGGHVVAVEGDRTASALSARNVPEAEVVAGDVEHVLARRSMEQATDSVDLVVLDPPREGARRGVVEAVAARTPRAVAYVACDPAALARDVAVFAEHGYALRSLAAYDLFPMTHHAECVALLGPR